MGDSPHLQRSPRHPDSGLAAVDATPVPGGVVTEPQHGEIGLEEFARLVGCVPESIPGDCRAVLESADLVLMNNRLTDVARAVRLSRAVMRTIKQNLFWAFFYN